MEGKVLKLKRKIIIGLFILVITIGSIFTFLKINYLYMPYEYKESEIFWYEWHELQTPLRLEICSDSFEGECIYSTDEEDIKFIIEAFLNLDYTSRSRKEFEELNFDSSINTYDNRYLVNIRQLTKENEYGLTGPNLFTIDVYPEQPYIQAPGRTYYFFELPDDVREFICNFDENN